MKKKVFKITLISLMSLALLIVLFLSYVQLSYRLKHVVPPVGISASNDTSIIKRGEYLVMGPAHCWNCHATDGESRIQLGTLTGLSGGLAFKTDFGTIYSPNITPDSATGIGTYTDEMLGRAIRYSVKHDNTALIPFMSYNTMCNDDITAIVSYLRSIPPIHNKVPEEDLNMIGKIVRRFVIKPVIPASQPPKSMTPDTTIAYGRYIATSIGNCISCHTNRDKTGGFIGEAFAGGFQMQVKSGTFTTPNLTPDPETGALSGWTLATFTQRFRTGAVFPETPMPWKAFKSLSDNDLKALFNYFNSLKPIKNSVRKFTPNN